jgi:hypothetical protein
MFKKIAPQFRKVLYKWTPQEAKLLHGLKNLFQALQVDRLLILYNIDLCLKTKCLPHSVHIHEHQMYQN